jgi:hypothetical protein
MNYPREWQSQLEIAADAPIGMKLWRLSCARGGTGGRPFLVGDLPEFIESEPNSLPEEAESVDLPITINGQIAGESDLDYFRFQASAGQVVRIDMAAARLGSSLDPVIQVVGPDGHRVVSDDLRIGSDPVLAFRPTVTGEYRLLISNVTFKGGPSYVYRVTISTAPLIQYVFPPGGKAGTTRDVTAFALSGEGAPFKINTQITFPSAVGEWWSSGVAGSNDISWQVGEFPEATETMSNDSRDTATELAIPSVMNGRFETSADEDWYRFPARSGVPLMIECSPAPRWSPALPIVAVTTLNGDVLASASAAPSTRGTVRIEWQPPADGTYCLRLRDQGIRGGSEFIYRVTVQEAVPDFAITLKQDVINVVQGARAEIDVTIERKGGCSVPIELTVEGLPEGVRVEGHQVAANQTSTRLAFIAQEDARSCDVTLRIKGRAEMNGKAIEHTAPATHLGHDLDGVGLGRSEIDHVQLTVVHKPVFKLYCNEAYQYAHRGTIYPYLMEIERLNGFEGPIHLQVADRQIKDLDGIEIVDTTIPPGQTQVMLPIYLPETMHINVQAHSNVYSQGYIDFVDKYGQNQSMLVVSTMRCMVRTLPTVAKLRSINRDLIAQKGCRVRFPVTIERTSQFSGPVRVDWTNHISGLHVTPVTIPADQSDGELIVEVDPAFSASEDLTLNLRATGKMPGEATLVTETKVKVIIAD